jgi:hypothetical protein
MALFDIVWKGRLVVSRMEAETEREAFNKAYDVRHAYLMSVHESFLDVARAMKPWRNGEYTAMPAPVPGERIEVELLSGIDEKPRVYTVISWCSDSVFLELEDYKWSRQAIMTNSGWYRFMDGDQRCFKVLRVASQ